MSVLIKGMKFPDMCGHCRFATAFDCGVDGQFIPTHDARRKDCPLIEVPPHGRLGDLDEMFVEFVIEGQKSKRYKPGENWELNGEEIRNVISRLPTIIPAEEGEK